VYNINWNIEFKTEGKKYQLALLGELDIESSVENLVDTATIILPETVMNVPLKLGEKIKRGSEVTIDLGYNAEKKTDLKREFTGFVREIIVNNGSLKVVCEDAIFLFRKSIPNALLSTASVKDIAEYVCKNIDGSYAVDCDYGIVYEKFTIRSATGFDVLKKLQDETTGNIYFDSENKTLHIHPPYEKKTGEAIYSLQKNVEKSSLEYKIKNDYKVEIEIESTDLNGKVQKVQYGTTGGDKQTIKVGSMSKESMLDKAEKIHKVATANGYDGTFTAWLIPYVQAGYSVRIKDDDYPEQKGWYFVKSVKTTLSSSGGVRTVTPGIKLAN